MPASQRRTRPLRQNDPREIAGYALRARLGEGGQGVVYLGEGPDGQEVAVKLLHARFDHDAEARRYFTRELAALQRVAPFCTARVLEADPDADPPYVVSEYVDGPSLQAAVHERGVLAGADLDRLAVATATALGAIHAAGVVHRDFKPANVLLAADGPRVIDFGIARRFDATAGPASGVVGTPSYMSPEQLSGHPAGPELDLFAWACTIAYAANGRPPFGHEPLPAVINRILNADPDLGRLAGPLRGHVAACLHKDPAHRPTAAQLLTALLTHTPTGFSPPGPPTPTGHKPTPEHRTPSEPAPLPGAHAPAGGHARTPAGTPYPLPPPSGTPAPVGGAFLPGGGQVPSGGYAPPGAGPGSGGATPAGAGPRAGGPSEGASYPAGHSASGPRTWGAAVGPVTRPGRRRRGLLVGAVAAAVAVLAGVVVVVTNLTGAAGPTTSSPSASTGNAVVRSPRLGLEFWQGNAAAPLALTDLDAPVTRVSLQAAPFELRFPSVPEERAVQVCAWTDDSVFDITDGAKTADHRCFAPGTGMADFEHGSGTLFLNDEGHNYLIGDRVTRHSDTQDKVLVSSIFQGDTQQPIAEQRGDLYLTVFVDHDGDQVFKQAGEGEYEYLVLDFPG
ncbi:serine/threonine protein kinase [Nonomuraea sp. NPDC003214]